MSNAQIAVATDQLDLLAWHGSRRGRAFGEIYDPRQDGAKFGATALAIFRRLADGQIWTLPELSEGLDGLTTSHSARVRSIRKWMNDTGRGDIDVTPGPKKGLLLYQMVRAWPIAGQHYRSPSVTDER